MGPYQTNGSIVFPSQREKLYPILGLLVPLVGIFSPQLIWGLLIALVFSLERSSLGRLANLSSALTLIFGANLLWGLGLSTFNHDLSSTLPFIFNQALLWLLGAYVLNAAPKMSLKAGTQLGIALTVGFSLTLCFYVLDALPNHPVATFFKKSPAKMFIQSSLMLIMLFWPIAIFWLQKQPKMLFPIIISSLIGLYLIDCDTSIMALLLSISSGLLCLTPLKKLLLKFCKIIIPLSVMTTPWIAHAVFTDNNIEAFNKISSNVSYIHRLHIWKEASHHILKRPKGHGLNAVRRNPNLWVDAKNFSYRDKGQVVQASSIAPLHLHNAPLQIWFELGFIGSLLMAFFIYVLMKEIEKIKEPIRQLCTFCLAVTGLVTTWINLSFWQSWWLASLWIVLFFMKILDSVSSDDSPQLASAKPEDLSL